MSWRELLEREIDYRYSVTEKVFDLVDDSVLDWKPETGDNWMTTGQLVKHITTTCGTAFRGLITGEWGIPEEAMKDMSPDDMLPPAEKMPTISNMKEAKKDLAADKALAIASLEKCSDEDLAHKPAPVPWDPSEMVLGHRLLQMIDHLNQHKGQLFYYLKLQGKPVNTSHLWGM